MDIGQRLRQARLEKGLSQRQLCGDTITRNMLSLIENGSAKPSMDTLRYLAGRLEMPMGYFLEDSRQTPLEQERQCYQKGEYKQVLEHLAESAALSEEGRLLQILSLLSLAQEVIGQGKLPYARELLEQAASAGGQSVYYTDALERKRLLLCCRAYEDPAPFVKKLPDLTEELLARASIASPEERLKLLEAASGDQAALMRGYACLELGRFFDAAEWFHKAEQVYPMEAAQALEICYREQKDFEKAYFYACRCRDGK